MSLETNRGVRVRNASLGDAARILEIYGFYVEHTAITFEYETPSLAEFQNRMRNTMKRYPYLVVEQDGVVQGYAYAGPVVDRAAYSRSCELTIYLDKDARKQGLGGTLYGALEDRLKEMGMLNLYACVAEPLAEDAYLTMNSPEFHEHLGFKKVGELHKCGYKFGHWYNILWMEKMIGGHPEA